MRLVSWLDQLSVRQSRTGRERLWRRWPMAEMELLEDRTQLMPMINGADDVSMLLTSVVQTHLEGGLR